MSTIDLARSSGQVALALLALSLFSSLFARTRKPRRALGLAATGVAALHALYALTSPLVEAAIHLVYEPHLRAGATALLILLVLSATSFPKWLRVPEWQALHRAVYAAALFALLHVWLSSHATRRALIISTTTVAAALSFRLARTLYRSRRAMLAAPPAPPPTSTPDRP